MKARVALGLLIALAGSACGGPLPEGEGTMSFFVTSRGIGDGGNLGGLAGADAHCATLAAAAGATHRAWRAYLSTSGREQQSGVDARDRIGPGPWYNARGVLIASDRNELHSSANRINRSTAIDERGEVVRGNAHDILTGSEADGTAANGSTCGDWTMTTGVAMLGHHNRQGAGDRPGSWNAAHLSRGCDLPALQSTSGEARFYCFAID